MSENKNKNIFKRVMLVDDSCLDLHIIRLALKRAEFAEQITEMRSAAEAIDHLKTASSDPTLIPEIIFLDLYMPGLTGKDFLELFHNLPQCIKQRSSVYILSSSRDDQEIAEVRSNKYVKGFIQKPLLDEYVLDRIAKAESRQIDHRDNIITG